MPIPNSHKRTPLFLLPPHDATGNGGNSVERRWRHGVNDDGNKVVTWWNDGGGILVRQWRRHCCKVSDEAAFCLIQRPYISKTLLTRPIGFISA